MMNNRGKAIPMEDMNNLLGDILMQKFQPTAAKHFPIKN
jgi:hypothetical protein